MDDLLRVAKRVIWFKTPQDALQDTKLFLAHVMTYGNLPGHRFYGIREGIAVL